MNFIRCSHRAFIVWFFRSSCLRPVLVANQNGEKFGMEYECSRKYVWIFHQSEPHPELKLYTCIMVTCSGQAHFFFPLHRSSLVISSKFCPLVPHIHTIWFIPNGVHAKWAYAEPIFVLHFNFVSKKYYFISANELKWTNDKNYPKKM